MATRTAAGDELVAAMAAANEAFEEAAMAEAKSEAEQTELKAAIQRVSDASAAWLAEQTPPAP
jgi:hypothetical protein